MRRAGAHSSVGQSSGLIIRRSWDHAPLGPQKFRDLQKCRSFLFYHLIAFYLSLSGLYKPERQRLKSFATSINISAHATGYKRPERKYLYSKSQCPFIWKIWKDRAPRNFIGSMHRAPFFLAVKCQRKSICHIDFRQYLKLNRLIRFF